MTRGPWGVPVGGDDGEGGRGVEHGNGSKNGGALGWALKAIFGSAPPRWLGFILLGIGIWYGVTAVRDFKNDNFVFRQDLLAQMRQMVRADSLNMVSNMDVRAKLLGKVNTRLDRLYRQNGWVYEDIEP